MKSFFQLVNEIHKHQLDEIPLPKNKPFDNIFGKKDRIVIPAKEDNRIKDFEQKLAKHGYKPNYKDNVVEKKVNTQKGSKIVKKAMGKAIAEFAPKLLNWYSDNKSCPK